MKKLKDNLELIKPKKKMGAPVKVFDDKDWKILNNAILFGTEEYCARELEVSISTLVRRIKEKYGLTFDEFKAQKEEWKLTNLKLKQYSIAMGGNVSMLIWLGKNLLNQSDKSESNVNIIDTKKIQEDFRNIVGL